MILAICLLTPIVIMNYSKRLSVIPDSYQPLLNLIANVESKGNYNAYFGNAGNKKIRFTDMTIAEVQEWQQEHVAQGSPSSAVGRYQIINTTLDGLVRDLRIDRHQKFDEATQDKMAIALLERRGSIDFVNQEIDRQQFAANLAMEWASLPKTVGDNPDSSYYAGDGLNRSLVSKDHVMQAIDEIKPVE